MKGSNLGEFEELVLLIIAANYRKAYGVQVQEAIKEEMDRDVNISAIHAVMKRLEKKGYVESLMGDPSPERGGRRKRLFTVTKSGARALEEVHNVRSRLFGNIPEIAFSKS